MVDEQRFIHGFDPIFDNHSSVLILGTFPSVRSRADGFYYAHPRNRFWPMIAAICDEVIPVTIEDKRALLLKHNIALYDAALSCEITGSADSSIKNTVPTDLSPIFFAARIKAVAANGKTAAALYKRHHPLGFPITALPSTSPANAAYSLDALIGIWRAFLEPYI